MTGEPDHRRRRPQQSRSQRTYDAILDAAAEQFAERGFADTTTHQIAQRAGLSVGTLYRYFADKEALFTELYEREFSSLRERMLAAFEVRDVVGQDLRALVRKTLTLAFQIYSERPALQRELRDSSGRIPALAQARLAQERQVHAAVTLLLSSTPLARVDDAEAGAYLVSLFIESLLDDYVLRRAVAFDQPRLLDAATEFVLRALGVEAG